MDVKTLCLGLLCRGDATGYEIKKSFEEGPFSHFHQASFGAIYPALTALSENGLVVCTEMAQERRPAKKVYAITERGQQALVDALLAPPALDKVRSDFLYIMFFAQLLPPTHLAGLIDQRIDWYKQCLARMESCDVTTLPAGERFVHGMGLTIYRAAVDYLITHREQLLDGVSAPAKMVAE